MRRIAFIAIVSIAVNIVLASWLVNNYFSDEFFRSWVNWAFAQYYPYIVISMGVSGGSLLGYLLLKRRSGELSGPLRLERTRPQKPGSMPVLTRGIEQGALLGSSAQAAKHTAYAVPPPPKTGPPSVQRTPSPAVRSPPMSSPQRSTLQRPETGSRNLSPQFSSPSSPGPKFAAPPSSPSKDRVEQSPIAATRTTQVSSPRFSLPASWRPETGSSPERKLDPSTSVPKPMDLGTRTNPPTWGQPPAVQPPKWQSPESGVRPVQRGDNVSGQGYSPKWVPPPGQTASPQQGPVPRATPFSPQRPAFGQPALAPRPLAYPGAARPMVGPGPARPNPMPSEQNRPTAAPPKMSIQSSATGSSPNSRTPTRLSAEKTPASAGAVDKVSSLPPSEPQGAPLKTNTGTDNLPSGELDWDTALDTILKTLRKDKVETK